MYSLTELVSNGIVASAIALSGFVLNIFVANLGSPCAFSHALFLYAGTDLTLSVKCIGSYWVLGFTYSLESHFTQSGVIQH